MIREYVIRGERVEIEQLEELLAVMPSERGISPREAEQRFGVSAERPDDERDGTQSVEASDWAAFEEAGWLLVYPSDEVRLSVEAGRTVPDAEAVQMVFREPSGRLFLGTDRLVVQLRPELSEDQARSAIDAAGLEIDRPLTFAPNLFEVRLPGGDDRDFLDVSLALSEDPEFLSAEPEFIEHIPPRFTPTDPDYPKQWQWNNTGQGGGTPGADISAEEAWDLTRGAGTRVAVIDRGMKVDHNDLQAAVVGTSGYFTNAPVGSATFVPGTANFPDVSHGTFCAGMAVARANNGDSGCGVANEADLIAVGCLPDYLGTQATLARAVAFAADPSVETSGGNPGDGADVISCSLGPNGTAWTMTSVLQLAIDAAVTHGRGGLGTPIFWATDNSHVPIAQDQVASYANTIAVGCSTRNDTHGNTAFGPELDFLAPGVFVVSTVSGGGTRARTGTSYAAPAAAGVAALVLATDPNLSWQQVRDAIRETCDQVGGVAYDANGHNDTYGYGRVNAARAVQHVGNAVAAAAQRDGSG